MQQPSEVPATGSTHSRRWVIRVLLGVVSVVGVVAGCFAILAHSEHDDPAMPEITPVTNVQVKGGGR